MNSKDAARARSYFCAYCGKPLYSPEETTIDHIIPKSRGGSNHFRNLIPACLPCNRERGNKTWVVPQFSTTTGDRLTPAQRKGIMERAFLVSTVKRKAATLEKNSPKKAD